MNYDVGGGRGGSVEPEKIIFLIPISINNFLFSYKMNYDGKTAAPHTSKDSLSHNY